MGFDSDSASRNRESLEKGSRQQDIPERHYQIIQLESGD
jgi:hypothetical protein